MEYLLITPEEYNDAPRLRDFHEKINANDFYQDRSYRIPMRTIIRIHPNEFMNFTDYLFQSVPLFSPRAMQVIWRFSRDFLYKEMILFDPEEAKDKLYYLPFFPRFPAAVMNSPAFSDDSCDLDDDQEVRLTVPYEAPMFYVVTPYLCLVFMRLDVVESLLRHSCRGFAIRKVTVEEEAVNAG